MPCPQTRRNRPQGEARSPRYLLVEKDPAPLVASFASLSSLAGSDGFAQMRSKTGQFTKVWALVKVGDRWYSSSREAKATLGGCGG
ncbi:MAG: hypothetical protein C0505_08295 [Leptothrix sp. (in: Bacteria)]|nr:hypothetical protein [Leptothrix sp. (in: b-proteobacteria)]